MATAAVEPEMEGGRGTRRDCRWGIAPLPKELSAGCEDLHDVGHRHRHKHRDRNRASMRKGVAEAKKMKLSPSQSHIETQYHTCFYRFHIISILSMTEAR